MKRKLLFLAAMMTATVMNLQAAPSVDPTPGMATIVFSVPEIKCDYPTLTFCGNVQGYNPASTDLPVATLVEAGWYKLVLPLTEGGTAQGKILPKPGEVGVWDYQGKSYTLGEEAPDWASIVDDYGTQNKIVLNEGCMGGVVYLDVVEWTKDFCPEPQPVQILPEGVVANVTGNRWSVKEKNMVVAGNPTNGYEAYFAATDTAAADVEQLWKTNGAESAVKVSSFSSEPDIKWLARFNDQVVFQAEGKLYTSDGAAITEIKAGGTSLNNPMGFTQINENKFIFTATVGEKNHLFSSDGTTAESLYADDAAGFSCVFPGEFHADDMNAPWCRVGRKVYFKATTTAAGEELWITDGTAAGTRMVKDINAGEGGSKITKMVNVNNTYLVFKAWSDDTRKNFIWYSNGTEAGTKYFDAPSLVQSDNTPRNMAVMNGKVYTGIKGTAEGSELFAFDPAAGTGALVKDFNAGAGESWPDVLGAYEGQMMTIANVSGCDLFAVTEAGVATKAGWNIAFPDGGYAQVNGSFISYGLYTKVGGDWGLYRIDSVSGLANAKSIYNGVTSGNSSDGIPCGYSMRSASNKLFFAVTTGDWAHKADNRGVFCYQYCKEGGVAENIEIDFDPAQIIVTYDLQGHGEAIKNDTIMYGDKLTRPADPEAEGYEFRNWYTDAQSLGKAFDFSKAVTADKDTTITIYAKWRDPAAWEQFKKDLDKYSYVEYDSTYEAGFLIHLATTQDAQVQPLKDAAFIEASEDVLANYDFRTLTTTIVSLYPALNGELGRCMGEESPESPIRRRPRENYFLKLISAYTQLPYRANGLNAVRGLYTSYVDLLYKAWLETNYENDADICKCILDSEVFFKGSTKLREAFDVCEK